jgi:outer membrane protein
MNIKPPIIALLFLFSIAGAFSQNSILEGYIAEGLKSNLQLQREQLNVERSMSGLAQSKSYFFPRVSASSAYTLASGGRTITIPVGDLMNPVYATLNQLTGTNQFPQIENSTTQFLPNNFHDTKIRIIQPLFNSDIYFGYKAQKELITVQQAQKNVYENELRYSITSSYLQYLQSEEAISILASTRQFVTELVDLNRKLVANDKITRDALLTSEYELAKVEQQLSEAEKNNQTAQAYFNFLLNRDWSANIQKDSALVSGVIDTQTIETLAGQAVSNRQEIKQLQGARRANEVVLDMNQANQYLPKLSAVADLGYQGFEYKFNNEQQYALMQFNLTWDLFRGMERKAKTRQAEIDQQLLDNRLDQTKKLIELEVVQAHQELRASEKSFIAAQSGVRSAERALQIVNARYREGQALLIELLDAQNKLTLAQLNQSVTRFELLRKEAALQKAVAGI